MSCPKNDFLMFLLAMSPIAGYHLWRFRDPEFRKAYRDWGSKRDFLGTKLRFKYPGITISFIVSFTLVLFGMELCGY